MKKAKKAKSIMTWLFYAEIAGMWLAYMLYVLGMHRKKGQPMRTLVRRMDLAQPRI